MDWRSLCSPEAKVVGIRARQLGQFICRPASRSEIVWRATATAKTWRSLALLSPGVGGFVCCASRLLLLRQALQVFLGYLRDVHGQCLLRGAVRDGGIVDVITCSSQRTKDRLWVGGKGQRFSHAEGELLHVSPARATMRGWNVGARWVGAHGVVTVLQTQE